MRLTIIPSDKSVYVEGVWRPNVDMSACGIPSDVHALQWFNTKGWIEFKDDTDPFSPKPENQIITELPNWANAVLMAWENTPEPVYDTPTETLFDPITGKTI